MGRSKNPAQMAFEFEETSSARMPPQTRTRPTLFFAILPDADCAESASRLAADLRREHGLTEKPRPLSLLHMTLCGLGEVARLPEDTVARAIRTADKVGGAAFSMKLDEILSFRQRTHPLVLCGAEGSDAFRMLHIRLALALQNCGFRVAPNRKLQPHMTLAYKGKEISRTRLITPILLRVTEFVLICSHHGEGRHEYLGRWPLCEPQAIDVNTFS